MPGPAAIPTGALFAMVPTARVVTKDFPATVSLTAVAASCT
jgi:hypothetical protein